MSLGPIFLLNKVGFFITYEILLHLIEFHYGSLALSPNNEASVGGNISSLNGCPVLFNSSSFFWAGLG
jgi:hypothetical protein